MSNQTEVQAKKDFIKSLFQKDRFLSPNDVVDSVKEKFGSGISKVEVANIRLSDFDLKFGPGGFAFDSKGKRVTKPNEKKGRRGGKRTASLGKGAADSRLVSLINQLQAEMAKADLNELTVPLQGPVQGVQLVRQTVQLS